MLLISYGLAWQQMDRHKADFSALFAAATLYKQDRPVYDLSAQCEIESNVGATLCLPFTHPPILLRLMALVVTDDYDQSYWRWVGILALVVLLCAIPLYRITNDPTKCLSLIAFFPIYLSMLQGQDSAFILLAILTWAALLLTRRDALAGLALSLAAIKPHVALALGIPLLFCRPRAFSCFVLGCALLALYSLVLVGPDGMKGDRRSDKSPS